MPLPTPILDDRSYQQLRDELVRRIPVYAPEWTNHNVSDPGIALIELFAFLAENLLFRFNQIPEATKLAFLRLLDIPLRPASSARALVTATKVTSPSGTLIEARNVAAAGRVEFETTTELFALPIGSVAVAKVTRQAPAIGTEQADFAAGAMDAADVRPTETPSFYETQLLAEDPSGPDALPVDFAATVDRMLWIAVLSTKETDLDRLAGALLNVGVIPDETVASIDDVTEACRENAPRRSDTVWEASVAGQDDPNEPRNPTYRPLTVEADTGRNLTRQGVVRIRLPRDIRNLGLFTPANPERLGTRDLPPLLDDDEIASKVLFWLRVWPRQSSQSLGRITWAGVNATEVEQVRTAQTEYVGTGTAEARQTYRLKNRNVIPDSLVLEVEDGADWHPWIRVDGFEASREDDRHYLLDAEAGTVRFGDGVRGLAPQIGQRVRAVTYRHGGGLEGNVGAKAISTLTNVPAVPIANLLPARGGAATESIEKALERVPGEFRRHDRAVTANDFQEIALATPGADVGRAECMPLFHPPTRKLDAAGVVSVVVWPREDRRTPNAPMPDRTALRQVCAYLDARRLVTTELWVIPPTYRKVAVAVGVEVKPGFGIEAVRRWVELVVRQYLAPLPPYGPEGQGWPLGRTVYPRELEAAALQVDGVRALTNDVQLAVVDPVTGQWIAATEVPLAPWEVVELGEITVVEGQPLSAGTAIVPPAAGTVPVPIPVILEEC